MKFQKSVVLTVILSITTLTFVVPTAQTILSSNSGVAKADDSPITIAVMGDSTADEYRADNNRGGDYAATTLSWVELLVKYRDINFGKYAKWGGFRRTGYEYNFSLSGATTSSALEAGVDKSIAKLVEADKVQYVFYALGTNDFHWFYPIFSQIYSGQLSGADLDAYIQKVVTNITTALDTINASHKAKILVSLIPDLTLSPFARIKYPDADKLKRVADAVAKANDSLSQAAADRGYSLFDINGLAQAMFAKIDSEGNLIVGGEKITIALSGDEPHHLVLSDEIHSGTVGSGLYANEWISAANTAFGIDIQPFSDDELLANAGIKAGAAVPSQGSQSVLTDLQKMLQRLFAP